jgi:hypothetical protein
VKRFTNGDVDGSRASARGREGEALAGSACVSYPGHRRSGAPAYNKLFAFAEAFDLNQPWLERHPDNVDAQENFAEAAFTVGRFAEAEQRLAALVDRPELKPGTVVALRALEICSLVALDRPDTLQAKLGALDDLLKGSLDRVVYKGTPVQADWTWTFAGSRHFISKHPELSRHPWLIRLLTAVEQGSAAAARAAVGVGQAASAAAAPQ